MTLERPVRRLLFAIAVVVGAYGLLAYIVLPAMWTHYEHQSRLAGRPAVTQTSQGIPGDALNVGLVGSRDDILLAMHAAGYFPADPITLESSVRIVGSVLLDRPYRDAPVSNLFYDGRKQDLAFERPDGRSADRRHHVRFWQVLEQGAEGRPVWLGAATFDRGVGMSRYTGQVTHRIAPDIDAERDFLVAALTSAGMALAIYQVSGVGPTLNGRNGEGDAYYTDGEIKIMRLVAAGQKQETPPVILTAPALVEWKDNAWKSVREKLGD